jgi:mannose-1-phosphate guanylyltransferase/phosphomannomutase
MATVDDDAIRAASFKVVLDYAYGSASFVMPNVLAKVGAEVLAVNPYASTAGAVAFDRWEQAARVGELVRVSGAHLGAVLDPDGERLTLVDDTAHVLSDEEALFALLSLVGDTEPMAPGGSGGDGQPGRVGLPVSVSRAAEGICRRAGVGIAWTKLSGTHLMEVAASGQVRFAASQDGGYIFPAFLPVYDAAAAFTNVLAMMAATGLTLSKIVSQSPTAHIAHRGVVTPWEQKGMVMRTLVERLEDHELILVDGVKVVHDDGWALVLPDPDEPLTHVWAEGTSQDDASRRADEYVALIGGDAGLRSRAARAMRRPLGSRDVREAGEGGAR